MNQNYKIMFTLIIRTGWTPHGDSISSPGDECTSELSYAVTVSSKKINISFLLVTSVHFCMIQMTSQACESFILGGGGGGVCGAWFVFLAGNCVN